MRRVLMCSVRALAASFVSLMLVSCALGPDYGKSQAALTDVGTDHGRVVFFREWHFVGSALSARIKIDGKKIGSLANAAVIQIERSPGDLRIAIDHPLNTGECVVPLTIEAGKTYYIEIGTPAGGEYMFGAAGVLFGSMRADVHEYCGGGWCAALRDESDARPKIEGLTLQSTSSL